MDKRWYRRVAPLFALMFAALLVVGCAGGAEDSTDETDSAMEESEEPAEEPMEMAGLDASILDDPARPDTEMSQDDQRMPLEVYEFVGIEPGMTVADLWPGGGYNTFLLSKGLGEEGTVYSVLGFYNDFQDGAVAQRFRDRVATDGLANVMVVDTIAEIPAGTLDAAIAVRNYHDLYAFELDPQAAVAALHAALKPGGMVGIIEVATDRDGWDGDTHRLNEQVVIDDFTNGGFELVESSDMLANPDDDHSVAGFQEGGRHTMDRYLLKFRKVESMESDG